MIARNRCTDDCIAHANVNAVTYSAAMWNNVVAIIRHGGEALREGDKVANRLQSCSHVEAEAGTVDILDFAQVDGLLVLLPCLNNASTHSQGRLHKARLRTPFQRHGLGHAYEIPSFYFVYHLPLYISSRDVSQ